MNINKYITNKKEILEVTKRIKDEIRGVEINVEEDEENFHIVFSCENRIYVIRDMVQLKEFVEQIANFNNKPLSDALAGFLDYYNKNKNNFEATNFINVLCKGSEKIGFLYCYILKLGLIDQLDDISGKEIKLDNFIDHLIYMVNNELQNQLYVLENKDAYFKLVEQRYELVNAHNSEKKSAYNSSDYLRMLKAREHKLIKNRNKLAKNICSKVKNMKELLAIENQLEILNEQFVLRASNDSENECGKNSTKNKLDKVNAEIAKLCCFNEVWFNNIIEQTQLNNLDYSKLINLDLYMKLNFDQPSNVKSKTK